MRWVLATALAVLSGVLVGWLPSVGLVGSASEPPGAWVGGFLFIALMGSLTMAAVLPTCLVVRWIMRRRRQRGPLAAAVAGSAAAAVVAVAFGWLPGLVLDDPPSYWSVCLPLTLYFAGFALTWQLFMEWMTPSDQRLPVLPERQPNSSQTLQRARRTAIETLAAVASIAPLLLFGFIFSFLGQDTGEAGHRVMSFPSPAGLSQAHVVYSEWGSGDMDADVYVTPSATKWTERDRGWLVWSGTYVDSVRVAWDTEHLLRVQARMDSGCVLDEYSQAWSRSGYRVRTEPLR